MRIYRMTATFGKLEHETLTLEPGLNIITAPNEWGKSTWCAFLVAMLYGIDTRSKTTKTTLAEKDRYAPWSGAPMEGRIDLNWQGRDISIERKTTRRIPLGEFSAYETHTGIPVPELTAANCGQMLLGVEQTVFRRSGFIRLADLPVTQDEALRRRLNALVTTGDENDAADRLALSLKELRNKIRYNRTGLLPQAEEERFHLENALSELDVLETDCKNCRVHISEIQVGIDQLTNHLQTLEYAAMQENTARLASAQEILTAALADLRAKEAACEGILPLDEAQAKADKLHALQTEWAALQPKIQQLPPEPRAPLAPPPFEDLSIENARKMVHQDTKDYIAAKRTTAAVILILMGILGMISTGLLVFLKAYLFAAAAGAGSLAALIWGTYEKSAMKRRVKQLQRKYGTGDQSRWSLPLTAYEKQYRQYVSAAKTYRDASSHLQLLLNALNARLDALCGDETPEDTLRNLNYAIHVQQACLSARREAERAQSYADSLQATVKPVQVPSAPDALTLSEEETRQHLTQYTAELHRLQNLLGQFQGKMDSLGARTALQQQLEQQRRQILKLENTYTAVTIAQETLLQAKEELQRRFAPRITARAQDFLSAMTDGRYKALYMDTEFSLRAGAEGEDTLRDALWRSDGTVDQLYLALRLAVSEELTPEAPLILDDALVRFDDKRVKAAVDLLEEMALQKQIILFSCQGREQAFGSHT